MTLQRDEKKAAIAAYKERKTTPGVYAVRCVTTGFCWVGGAPNLDTIKNRLWFTLNQGNSPHQSLQKMWRDQSAEAFVFEEIEQLDDDLSDYARDRALKDRLAHWAEKLHAEKL